MAFTDKADHLEMYQPDSSKAHDGLADKLHADTQHSVQLVDKAVPHKSGVAHVLGTGFEVIGDLAKGALKEAKEHPNALVRDFAVGAVAGAAAVALPELMVAGALVGGYVAIKNNEKIVHAMGEFKWDVATLGSNHASNHEKHAATNSLYKFGEGGAHVAAGVAGGAVGGLGAVAWRKGIFK